MFARGNRAAGTGVAAEDGVLFPESGPTMAYPGLQPAPDPYVSVVLPARNEQATIDSVVRRVGAALAKHGWSYELILGDSASNDGTVARAVGADPATRVVREDRPGKGLVLTRALQATRGEIVAFMDADLDLAPEDLPALIAAVRAGAGCAAAEKTGEALAARPLLRRFGSRLFNTATRLLLRTGLSDHQTGMKAFHGPTLRGVLPDVKEQGWLWDTEVLWRLRRAGAKLCQVPVAMHGAGNRAFPGWGSRFACAGQMVGFFARLAREADAPAARPRTTGVAPTRT